MIVFGSSLKNTRSARSAIVPYTLIRDENTGQWMLWFMFGVHGNTLDLTDLGGGIKKHENDLEGSLREFTEESKKIFGDLVSIDKLATCVSVIYNKNTDSSIHSSASDMSVTFLPINSEWVETSCKIFDNTEIKGAEYNELSKLIWISEPEFLGIKPIVRNDKNYVIWSRLRKFYDKIYTSTLHDLLHVRYWWYTSYFAVDVYVNTNTNSNDKTKKSLTLSPATPILFPAMSGNIILTTTIKFKLSSASRNIL